MRISYWSSDVCSSDPHLIGYTDAMGLPTLRRRIARHYGEWYGHDLDPRRVMVTTGSSAGFLIAFLAAFDAGDRVALAAPGYPAYRNILDRKSTRLNSSH